MADKYDKAKLIRIVKMVEIVLMASASIAFFLESVFLLMIVLFLMGTQSAFFGPVKYGILPDQLAEDELIGGNALIETGTFLSILLGTIFGGVLIKVEGGVFIVSAIILAVSALGLAGSWFIPKTIPEAPELKVQFNILTATWDIVQYARKRRDVFLSILGISWFWLFGATFLAQFPTYGKYVIGGDERIVTLFLAVFSIGIGLGSLFCNKLLNGEVEASYVPIAALGMTLFTVDLYYASKGGAASPTGELIGLITYLSVLNNWRILLDLLMISACGGVYIVPLYAILQNRSEKSHRARTIASNNVLNALFMVVSALATMVMLSMDFTVPQVFLALAIANGAVSIYICKLLPEVLVRNILKGILNALYRVEIHGLENFKKAGDRVILVANHLSFLDALLFAVYMPERLTYAVNTHIARNKIFKPILALADFITLDPTNPMATRSLIQRVKENRKVVIFPEGRLTVTGSLMKIYEGPGMIADKSGAQLLPVRIQGAQYTPFSRLRDKVRIRLFPKITMTVMEPRPFDLPPEVKGRKRRKLAGARLYEVMTDTLFQSADYGKPLFQSILDARSVHGGRHVIAEDIERKPITYNQLIARCFILGGAIAKATKHGENVGVLLPNSLGGVVTLFALHAYGRVPAMLNFSSGPQNIISACKTAEIGAVYTSRKFIQAGKLEALAEAVVQAGSNLIYLEDLRGEINTIAKLKGLFFASTFPETWYHRCAGPRDSESPAIVLFTSGSEGTPKGVVLSHRNLQANRTQLDVLLDLGPKDIVFSAMPIFHSFGLTGGLLLPLLSGIRTFFYPSPLHYRVVPELAYDTNATVMFGTDTFLTGYSRHAHPYDFHNLRYVFAGAEKLKAETVKTWAEKFGVRLFEGYGATETAPALTINTPMGNKHGTVGRFLPGIRHRLEPVPGIDGGGRLFVAGPNIMSGYLKADQPGVLQPPEDGWYDTGDIVDIDEEGFVTIKGRAKRFAKVGGEMVSLTAVEVLVSNLWPDHIHAVVSLPDAKKGEQLILVTDNGDATREVLIAHAREKGAAELGVPKKILRVNQTPILGTGKIDYVRATELALEEFTP